jgi:hypothetical protein
LPEADITPADLFHFFTEEFGFTDKQTVALTGAHTIGSLSRENSGFDGANGWVRDNTLLDNDYYIELVGSASPASSLEDSSLEDFVDGAPPWVRFMGLNQDLEGIPDKFAW